jgi:hypothetical protein
MVDADFPDYAVKETKVAVSSRRGFSAEQIKILDEIMWSLAENPQQFEPLSTRTGTGQLVYRHPTLQIELTYSVDVDKKVLYFFHFSAPLPPRQTIFISYSREDATWLRMVRKFLDVLEKEGVISFWDDSAIKPGEPWEESIRKALDCACAAVLLVSQDFLASKFITAYELPRILSDARREGKKIFWIPVRASTVFDSYPEIAGFQALTDDPENVSLADLPAPLQEKALVQVYRKLRGALEQ